MRLLQGRRISDLKIGEPCPICVPVRFYPTQEFCRCPQLGSCLEYLLADFSAGLLASEPRQGQGLILFPEEQALSPI